MLIGILVLTIPSVLGASDTNQMLIASKAKDICVQLNGENIDFTDAEGNVVNPQIINNRTMVPMRKIFETLGAEVEWDGDTKTIKATTDSKEITLVVNQEMAKLKADGGEEEEFVLDSVPVIRENRTLVPIRFIAESLDKIVDWDADNRTVIIMNQNIVKETLKEKTPTFYEFLTQERFPSASNASQGEITGKIKYTDKEEKANTSTLTLAGNYSTAENDEVATFQLEANITGKGPLMDAVKESKLATFQIDAILDVESGDLYLKSELLDEKYAGKWVKYAFTKDYAAEYRRIAQSMEEGENLSSLEILESVLMGGKLNKDSYQLIQMYLEAMEELFAEDSFKLTSQTSSRKTYTFTMDLEKILAIGKLTNLEIENIEELMDLKVTVEIQTKENEITKTEANLSFGYQKEEEEVVGEMSLTSKPDTVQDSSMLSMPSEKELYH